MIIGRKMLAGLLVAGLCLVTFAGCAGKGSTNENQDFIKEIYERAVEFGFDGSYFDFLEQIKGKNGQDGKDGVGIQTAELDAAGNLLLVYSDGTTVNLGKVRGENGQDGENGLGIEGVSLSAAGELIVRYSDGTSRNLGNVKGENGRGISDFAINAAGELVVTLTDGEQINAGKVSGKDGANGTQWHTGAGVPDESTGAFGDLYFDTQTHILYQKKEGWTQIAKFGALPQEEKITLTFRAAGGAFQDGTDEFEMQIERGSSARLPVPKRENFLFAGWFRGEGLSEEKVTDFTLFDQDTVLTAKWMPVPQIVYRTGRSQQCSEGEPVPEAIAEISDLYGVQYADCRVWLNERETEENPFRVEVVQTSLGRWRVRLTADSLSVGVYRADVTVYGEYTSVTLSFETAVTAQSLHTVTEIRVGEKEADGAEITLPLYESTEIEYVLASTFQSSRETFEIDGVLWDPSEAGDALTGDSYTLSVHIEEGEGGKTVTVYAIFTEVGNHSFTLISSAGENTVVRVPLTFIVAEELSKTVDK